MSSTLQAIRMSRKVFDELPERLQREMRQYVERYNEWKKMCNLMNRLDAKVKEYMIGQDVDVVEGEGFYMSMAHPNRWILDQSLIENIDDYKVCKRINVLTVNVNDGIVGQKRARDDDDVNLSTPSPDNE